MRVPLLFRIFYSTFYTLLLIVLLGLILVTPSDAIRQALRNNQLYNVFEIAGCYVLTLFLGILIFLSRLYTNRAVLAAIPKTWIPVEKGDVGKNVRKMIVDSLNRSAAIAWDARPRVDDMQPTTVSRPEARDAIAEPFEATHAGKSEKKGRSLLRKKHTSEDGPTVELPAHKPAWGDISHPGWSSPFSADLESIQYITVVLELPHLIEAKAVSLAPQDPDSPPHQPVPDLHAVDILSRQANVGLRDYVGYLIGLGIITDTNAAAGFLSLYEYSRFSPTPLTDAEFRDLMRLFADLLRSISELSPTVLDMLDDDSGSSRSMERETDSDTSASAPISVRSRSIISKKSKASLSSYAGSEGTISIAPSRRMGSNRTVATVDRTAFTMTPRSPKSRKRPARSPTALSMPASFSSARRGYAASTMSGTSTSTSGSGGSVIRLSRKEDATDLPYILSVQK
jgi:hypothetical protein